ncbi:MAG: exodeoxyribonuclease III [Ahrensia sp.]|nr:exodeoxyribonuclease III [Ahrensia sp.]
MAEKLFSIATWNINSVRLRIDLVEMFLKTHQPDVLCLQETKCPDDAFPTAAFSKLGYKHIAIHGQKGYHGVATISKYPLTDINKRKFCGIDDTRHIECVVDLGAQKLRVHNFYVPAGGDEPDRTINQKFGHKLDFLDEMREITAHPDGADGSILVGDLNIAPYESDVWSHKQLLKVVSHTPVETQTLEDVRVKGGWADLIRHHIPEPEPVFTWWSYRSKDWAEANRGRRLDHIWGSQNLSGALESIDIISQARGWDRPSDHVPVIARFKAAQVKREAL